MNKTITKEESLKAYYENSGKLSDIIRYLGYGSLGALIYLFEKGKPGKLFFPVLLVLLGTVILDFFQYLFSTLKWRNISLKEESASEKHKIEIPESCSDCIITFCFWGKTILIILGVLGLLVQYYGLINLQ